MFQSLAEKLDKQAIVDISFPLYVRISISREVGKKFPKIEKEYVTRSVAIVYPKMHKQSLYLIDRYVANKQLTLKEWDAQFYLVVAGLFPESLSKIYSKGGPAPEFYIKAASMAFKRAGQEDVADHIDDWIHVLNKIKVDKKS